jgi:hypothetical protein
LKGLHWSTHKPNQQYIQGRYKEESHPMLLWLFGAKATSYSLMDQLYSIDSAEIKTSSKRQPSKTIIVQSCPKTSSLNVHVTSALPKSYF